METTVATDGQKRDNPSLIFSPTAQPTSNSPAKNKTVHATCHTSLPGFFRLCES
jgi:hypothetical protein